MIAFKAFRFLFWRRLWAVAASGFLFCLWLAPAEADIIRFRDGTRFRGQVTKRSESEVVVKFRFGAAIFTPQEIISIEPEPEEELPSILTQAQSTDVAAGSSSIEKKQKELIKRAAALIPAEEPKKAAEPVALTQAMRAIAFIATLQSKGEVGVGSGAVISDKGSIITNYHVIKDAKEIAILLPGDKSASEYKEIRPHEGRVLRIDPCLDLAVVTIPQSTPDYLRLAADDSVVVGSPVRAVGNPRGLAISASQGIVSAQRTAKDFLGKVGGLSISSCEHMSDREMEKITWIQTDAAINPGNSGGPLLNSDNEIIGIDSFIISQSGGNEGIGFAVHVKHVRQFAKGYIQKPARDLNL